MTGTGFGNSKPQDLGFVLSYRDPAYIRAVTLQEGFRRNAGLAVHDAKNRSRGLTKYIQSLSRVNRIQKQSKPGLWMINFRGHEVYWPVRWRVGRKARIIFDELVSPYDAWVNERKTFSSGSLTARVIYAIERSILRNADLIITDSSFQAEYYAHLFQVPVEKFRVVRGSVDESAFNQAVQPRKFDFTEPFVVFTYGTFIPLQGMDFILSAAELLKDVPVRFLIAGGKGEKLAHFLEVQQSRALTNITHIPWIDFTALPSYIRGASLCLGGPFGNTAQAQRVITGKALQFLACGCPTVIGLSRETGEIFTDRKNCLLVEQGNPGAIAAAVDWAVRNPQDLAAIGDEGRRVYDAYYSMDVLTSSLASLLPVGMQ